MFGEAALGPDVGEPSRRARKKARTRREIFQAAMRLFLERGFDVVTIDDICHAADVARGTFFLHFPAKDALLAEYGLEVTDEVSTALRTHRGSAATGLRLALRVLGARAARHADVVRLMVREVMARPAALADATEQSRDLVQLLAALVRRGQASGEFRRTVDPIIAAAVVVSTYMAIVAEWAKRPAELDLDVALRHALDVVLGGLNQRRTPGRTRHG